MSVVSQVRFAREGSERPTQEIELRLATTDAAWRLLPTCAALASLDVSSARIRELQSVYWDTPAQALRNARIALRLRRTDGGAWVQTLKADRQDPHVRDEFEADLAHYWRLRTTLKSRLMFGKLPEESGLHWAEYRFFATERYASQFLITFAFVATHNHFVLDRGGKVFNRTAPVIKLPAGASEDGFW